MGAPFGLQALPLNLTLHDNATAAASKVLLASAEPNAQQDPRRPRRLNQPGDPLIYTVERIKTSQRHERTTHAALIAAST